jgi:acetyl esterase/lipase
VTGRVPRRTLLAAAVGLVIGAPQAPAAGKVRSVIVYGHARVNAPRAHDVDLVLDFYRPPSRYPGRRPVAVFIHGGGFRANSRRDDGLMRIARALAAEGIAVAAIDYRLLPQDPEPSERVAPLLDAVPDTAFSRAMVAAVDDTLTAMEYLRAHARALRIDPTRMGALGSSAGAITADHVGYVLDDHGISGPKLRFVGSLWGGILVPAPEGGVAAVQLDRGEPALFAVHGDSDDTVPVALDDQLVARAKAQRVRREYHRIKGGEHGYVPSGFFTAKVAGRRTPFDRLLRFAKSALG